MKIPFIKMEGCGNDYVYLDLISRDVPEVSSLGDLPELARRMSDRHYGIGSDGLILIHPSAKADARMQMFNSDGSESEMCGNGIRCVARHLHDEGHCRRSPLRIETGAGILSLDLEVVGSDVRSVRVNMGRPRLTREEIPMAGPSASQVIGETLTVGSEEVVITALSMGNPHCVVFVPDVDRVPVRDLGPRIETHPAFPARTNVEFVQVLSPREVRQRTWERGTGETLACGTGASAACVAGVLSGRTQRTILNHLRGGDLELEWSEAGDVYMRGPAREVFRGIWRSSL